MTIELYIAFGSSSCLAVQLVASAVGIDDKIKYIRLNELKDENQKLELVKLNPQKTAPTLVDDGFAIWESRAISRYLVNKYGGAYNSLYPSDVKTRALIDQRLDFDLGTLSSKLEHHFFLKFENPEGTKIEGNLKELQDALNLLNIFLEGHKFAVGDDLTIADLSLVATVATIEATDISIKEYPNIVRWFELVKKTAPNFQKAIEEPLLKFREFLKTVQ